MPQHLENFIRILCNITFTGRGIHDRYARARSLYGWPASAQNVNNPQSQNKFKKCLHRRLRGVIYTHRHRGHPIRRPTDSKRIPAKNSEAYLAPRVRGRIRVKRSSSRIQRLATRDQTPTVSKADDKVSEGSAKPPRDD